MPTLKNSESINLYSLLLSESVQFSPRKKKADALFIVVCRRPSQAAGTNIEIKSVSAAAFIIYFVLL